MEGEFIGCGSIVASFLKFSQIGVAEVLKVHIRSSARCAAGCLARRRGMARDRPSPYGLRGRKP